MIQAQPLAVSVVATVLNEGESVGRLVDSLAAQTRRPDEVVIVDGGSTDDTVRRIEDAAGRAGLAVRLIERPGANISAGRNAGIGAARGPVIACTDAGVRLETSWLAELTAPFASGARVASGFFASDPATTFELALGATTLPEVAEIEPNRFLPSSRSVAFLKDAWARTGGYPEWLDYCEDLVFDLRLLALSGPAAFVPGAVAHFRPRSSLAAFTRQYYRYARGDGKAGLWPARHAVRYATYGTAAAAGTVALATARPLLLAALAVGFGAAVARPYRRLAHQWAGRPLSDRLAAAAWVPVIRVAGDLAKMAGYPVGLAWRARHRPPAWRPAADAGRL